MSLEDVYGTLHIIYTLFMLLYISTPYKYKARCGQVRWRGSGVYSCTYIIYIEGKGGAFWVGVEYNRFIICIYLLCIVQYRGTVEYIYMYIKYLLRYVL